jgi:pyruvate formate lyase activating enzyme
MIATDRAGICQVRRNIQGKLISENYGLLTSVHSDPMEKKPLYHFHPGGEILSIGSVGCNMGCTFCQNFEISQTGVKDYGTIPVYTSLELVKHAASLANNIGIAYTYNEPTVFYEFMYETAVMIHDESLKNVMVTNGFIEKEPLEKLLPLMDAFNVDLKAFTDYFYKKYTHSQLGPVKRALQIIRSHDKHLEITNLVISGLNDNKDDFTAMVSWIANELGNETILHISRYFPRFKSNQPVTSDHTLLKFYEIAQKQLRYVYLGNVSNLPSGSDTFCSKCNALAIKRNHYETLILGMSPDGSCKSCGNRIVNF